MSETVLTEWDIILLQMMIEYIQADSTGFENFHGIDKNIRDNIDRDLFSLHERLQSLKDELWYKRG